MKLIHRSAILIALTAGMFSTAGSAGEAAPVKQSIRPGFWDRLAQKWLPSDKDALRFNEALLVTRKDMETAVGTWSTAVNTAFSLQASNGAKPLEIKEAATALRKAQTELEAITKKTIEETKMVDPHLKRDGKPSDAGKALKTANLKMLEDQLTTFQKDFAAVVALVEDFKIDTSIRFLAEHAAAAALAGGIDLKVLEDNGIDKTQLKERFTKAKEIITKARAAEKEQLKEVVKLQIAFAKEFNVD